MLATYGVDLLDYWRGRITPRRLAVLVAQLPPGSRLQRARGGFGAWTDEIAAIHREGFLIRGCLHSLISTMSGKKAPDPKPVEPPEIGWQAKAVEQEERRRAKAARWLARNRAT